MGVYRNYSTTISSRSSSVESFTSTLSSVYLSDESSISDYNAPRAGRILDGFSRAAGARLEAMIERLSGTMERERYLVEEPEPISESAIDEFSKSRIPTPSRSSSTETKVPPRTSVKPTPTEVLTMLRGLQKDHPIFSMVNMSALEESDAGAIEKLHELHLALADTFGSPNNNAPLKPPNSRLRRAPSATLNSVRRVWNRPGKLPQRTWSSFRDRAKRMNSKRREPEQITRENTLSTLVESNAEDD